MAKHRSHGEGSISQRASGAWSVALESGGVRRSTTCKTKPEAMAKLREWRAQAQAGQLPDPKGRTVSDLLTLWQETMAPRWRPRTASDAKDACERYVAPVIGVIKLSRLEPAHIQRLLTGLADKPNACRKAYMALHGACRLGVMWGWLPYNVCERVVKPTYRSERRIVWSQDELQRFLSGVEGFWLGPLWTVAIASGARLGELTALTWDDVGWDHSTIAITKSLQKVRGAWVEGEPKTEAGRRVVALPPQAMGALRHQKAQQNEWRLRRGPQWPTDADHVFTSQWGGVLPARTVTGALKTSCERLGLPHLCMHDLRHMSASLLLAQGVPIPMVSQRLGHGSPGITMGTYAHMVGKNDDAAAQAIGAALSRVASK
ncbi:MAG: tyrosine-type recombinase/integrase [Anaerolineae bacterium]